MNKEGGSNRFMSYKKDINVKQPNDIHRGFSWKKYVESVTRTRLNCCVYKFNKKLIVMAIELFVVA